MKRISLAAALVFCSVLLCGQSPFPSRDEIKQFAVSKTCVVLEDNQFSPYNSYIRAAMKEYWKIPNINLKKSPTSIPPI